MTDQADVVRLVDMLSRHRNAGDLDALMDLFAEDATLHIVGWGEPAVGKTAVRARVRQLIDDFAFLDVRLLKAFTHENDISIRYGLTVRHNPSGRIVDTELADFVTLRDGKFVAYTQHVDTAMLQALVRD